MTLREGCANLARVRESAPVRRSRFRCKFLISPKSQNLSWMSSSWVSSWSPLMKMIQPSTAAAVAVVAAGEPGPAAGRDAMAAGEWLVDAKRARTLDRPAPPSLGGDCVKVARLKFALRASLAPSLHLAARLVAGDAALGGHRRFHRRIFQVNRLVEIYLLVCHRVAVARSAACVTDTKKTVTECVSVCYRCTISIQWCSTQSPEGGRGERAGR